MTTPEVRTGSELGGYRVESLIGRGGMGVVFLAEHLRLKRKVALKVLAPELAGDERFRDRFMRESEVAASLDHPGIVTVHDAGEQDGLLYIAMRFVDGTDLQSVIEREGPLDPARTADLIGQIAAALDAAHAKGLIHRDVKPANVLIARDPDGTEHAYLTDFGLTRQPDQTTGLTGTGQFMGSVNYAAPEQFEGKPLDARTDGYSLACLAYQCLTGQVPFSRDQEAAVMYAHLRTPPPKPSDVLPDLPRGLDPVVVRGMAKRPEDRYPSAGALASALTAAVEGAGPAAEFVPRPHGLPPGGRRLIVAGVTVALIVVGAAFALTRGGPSPLDAGTPTAGAPTQSSATSNSGGLLRIDPNGHTILTRLGVNGVVAEGLGYVWVGTHAGLLKISPSTNNRIAEVNVPNVDDVAVGDGYVWVTAGASGQGANGTIIGESLYRVDPQTNLSMPLLNLPERVAGPAGLTPGQLAAGEGFVWITFSVPRGDSSLLKIDEHTGQVIRTIRMPMPADGVVVGEGAVWVRSNLLSPFLYKVEPKSGRIVGQLSLGGADAIVAAGGDVWVADSTDAVVVRVDPHSVTQSGLLTGSFGHPGSVAVGQGAVWVLDPGDCSLFRVDPVTGKAAPPFVLPLFSAAAVAAGEEGVWVTAGNTGSRCR